MTLARPGAQMRRANARRAELGYAALYAGLFLAMGAQLAFHQIWLEDWGLSTADIGLLNAAALAVRVAAGVAAPALADRWRRPREMMAAMAVLGCAAALGHLLAGREWQLFLLAALLAIAYSALIPLSDATGYAAADRLGFSYRRARSAGSLAFLLATFLVGALIDRLGVDLVMIWIAVALALAAIAAWRAPGPVDDAALPGSAARLRDFLARPVFLLFIAVVALIQSSHAVYYVYASVHWRGIGYSETLIGALWAWGVLAEIALFFAGAGWIARLGPARAMAAAGALAALRWAAMAWDPGLAAVIGLQTLHAASFAATHLAALAFIAGAAPPGATATAQGVLSAATGLAMMAATLLAAWVYPHVAGLAYLQGAAFAGLGAALALVLALVLARR